MLSNFEKLIYNKYLKFSRRGEGYKPRQNFDNFKEEDISILQKLAYMFNTYKSINIDDFIEAPFKIYESDAYVPLSFFCTQRAKNVILCINNKKS